MAGLEREFHRWLKQQNQTPISAEKNVNVKLGVGDDAAILHGCGGSGIVLATDAIAEGTHFVLAQHDLELIGRKALAVNLSDIAAMGATPVAALLTLQLPSGFSIEQAQRIFLGVKKLADEFSVAIIGGDTNRWEGPLVVSVTVVGHEFCSVIENETAAKSWRIGGAKVGDAIVVSGSFGGSILGHHLDFTPRVHLAQHLIANYNIHAATDVSDSLSLDLSAMASESQLGVEVELNQLPIAAAAIELAKTSERTTWQHALSDGEDFELVLAVPPDELTRICNDPVCQTLLTVIGKFVSEPGFRLLDDGSLIPFDVQGYSH